MMTSMRTVLTVVLLACGPTSKPPTQPGPAAEVPQAAAEHDLTSEPVGHGMFKLHDAANRISLAVPAEPRISPPLTNQTSRSKAVIDTAKYRLVVQYLVEEGLASDAASQQKYVAWFLEDMTQYKAGKASAISLGGRRATKVSGTAAKGALIAFMLVVPEHHRRYLFMCSGEATACERDLIANMTFVGDLDVTCVARRTNPRTRGKVRADPCGGTSRRPDPRHPSVDLGFRQNR
jgi:hypothetical protein